MNRTEKKNNETVDHAFLILRARRQTDAGFTKAKWIVFCEKMLAQGYTVELYEARQSFSKYIRVYNVGMCFRVRFSNHGASNNDCDFFVGINRKLHDKVTTTEEAIVATIAALGPCPIKLETA